METYREGNTNEVRQIDCYSVRIGQTLILKDGWCCNIPSRRRRKRGPTVPWSLIDSRLPDYWADAFRISYFLWNPARHKRMPPEYAFDASIDWLPGEDMGRRNVLVV